jgi:hypothetical protein
MDAFTRSRRSFLLSAGGTFGTAWLAAHWPEIAAAAEHAAHADQTPEAAKFSILSPAERAQVDAIAAQIIPSGATPGAREARVVLFIDRALATFFAAMAADFHQALDQFLHTFVAQHPGAGAFAAASAADRAAFMQSMEQTSFFYTVRFLTVLGFLASPKYGGNAGGLGWKAIGFEDRHIFEPPFGHYDRSYEGFVPYKAKARS